MKLFTLLTMAFLFQSCSSLLPHRSFSNEMASEEPSFFTPHEDFHVVGGDREEARASIKDIIQRTPASFKEKKSLNEYNASRDELKGLEESQSTENYYQYLEYENSLGSTSDKIYFLRLPTQKERNKYLYSRGHYQIDQSNYADIRGAINSREIVVGMKKDNVTESWGRPVRVDIAGNPSLENERWTFYDQGKMKHVYFENGLVQGWDIDQ